MNSTAEVNCTNFFTPNQFETLAIARGMSAGISFLACTFAVVLITYFHALDSLLKRLFLYLTVATGANLAALVLQLHEHFDEDDFCALIGFFVQYTTHIGLYIKIGASLTLLYYVRKPFRDQTNQRGKLTKHFLEFSFLTFSVLFPLTYTWVPFLFDAYGRAGAWCWIRRTNYADCSEVPGGLVLQVVLGYTPTILVAALSTIVIVTIVGTYCWLAYKSMHLNQKVQSTLWREAAEALLLVAYFSIFVIYCVIELVCSLAAQGSSYDNQPLFNFGIWVLYAILTPFIRLGIPVSFVIYLLCIRKIKCCRCHQKYYNLNGRNQQPQEERMNNRDLEGEPNANQRRPSGSSSHMRTSFQLPHEFSDELTQHTGRPTVVSFELPEPSSVCVTSFKCEYEFPDEHTERQPLNCAERHVQYGTVP